MAREPHNGPGSELGLLTEGNDWLARTSVIIYFNLLIFPTKKWTYEETKGSDHQVDCHQSYSDGWKGLHPLPQ